MFSDTHIHNSQLTQYRAQQPYSQYSAQVLGCMHGMIAHADLATPQEILNDQESDWNLQLVGAVLPV